MEISALEILQHIHPDATTKIVRNSNLDEKYEFSIEDLKVLIEANYVRGITTARGNLRRVELTVPPDMAFRQIGESRARVKDQLHSDASQTVIRDLETTTRFRKRHHTARTSRWNEDRGISDKRKEELKKLSVGLAKAYRDPRNRVWDVQLQSGLGWHEFYWALDFQNVERRQEKHGYAERYRGESVKFQAWEPYAKDELYALYRRAWGNSWMPSPAMEARFA